VLLLEQRLLRALDREIELGGKFVSRSITDFSVPIDYL
jgi:hypothetical protein